MGVKTCGRSDCENIMCDVLVNGRYMCYDCRQELDKCRESWPAKMSKQEMRRLIEEFYSTSTGTYADLDEEDTEEAFKSFFRCT